MECRLLLHVGELVERYPKLCCCKDSIIDAYKLIEDSYMTDHKLLAVGNGGSSCDASHIVGELMKSFMIPRPCCKEFTDKILKIDSDRGDLIAKKIGKSIPAISLCENQGLSTAFLNDVSDGARFIYAQQLYGYGKTGDVLLAISTSGNSENIINAAIVARAMNIKVIALTGENGGELSKYADVTIKAPETETYKVQELHLPIYHCLCMMIEERLFGTK